MKQRKVVLSLFDYTGEAVRPWAEAGYRCVCLDIQHDGKSWENVGDCGGEIIRDYWDASAPDAVQAAVAHVYAGRAVFVFGFPPCTDLASSGAKHWAAKRAADPDFQTKAVAMARLVADVADEVGGVPYVIENPTGALCTLWRQPDHRFDPCDFGGYVPGDGVHPTWPEYIPAFDAYTKRTCLWTGNGFVMPRKAPVDPVVIRFDNGKSGSPQWAKLGGKSLRTKNIRSATPRGFARAVFLANH